MGPDHEPRRREEKQLDEERCDEWDPPGPPSRMTRHIIV